MEIIEKMPASKIRPPAQNEVPPRPGHARTERAVTLIGQIFEPRAQRKMVGNAVHRMKIQRVPARRPRFSVRADGVDFGFRLLFLWQIAEFFRAAEICGQLQIQVLDGQSQF